MSEGTDTGSATYDARTNLDASLRNRVEIQITPILEDVMAALRESGLPEGQLLWRAIGIVEAAMSTIQRRARAATHTETE